MVKKEEAKRERKRMVKRRGEAEDRMCNHEQEEKKEQRIETGQRLSSYRRALQGISSIMQLHCSSVLHRICHAYPKNTQCFKYTCI